MLSRKVIMSEISSTEKKCEHVFHLWQRDRRLALGMALGLVLALILLGLSWWRVFTKPVSPAKSALTQTWKDFTDSLKVGNSLMKK
jgi:hypothetical protein